jgi:hypothetical protein
MSIDYLIIYLLEIQYAFYLFFTFRSISSETRQSLFFSMSGLMYEFLTHRLRMQDVHGFPMHS